MDHTRPFAASVTGTPVKAVIRDYTELLNTRERLRLKPPKDGIPKTWGETMEFRKNKQSSKYVANCPEGSWCIGVEEDWNSVTMLKSIK